MASVKYNLKTPKSEVSLILARVYYNGKSFKYSTKQRIETKFWNPEKQQARVVASRRFHSSINLVLSNLTSKIKEAHIYFQGQGREPSINEFKEYINHTKKISFLEFFVKYQKDLKQAHITNEENINKPNRKLKKARIVYNHLLSFFRHKNKTYDFKDLDIGFFKDFFNYMYKKNKTSSNTLLLYFQQIKYVIRLAESNGYNINKSYKSPFVKVKTQETDTVYLNLKEITKLYQLKNLRSSLEKIRDVFIVGCFTGLRFSDFTNISYSNIKQIFDEKGNEITVISIRSQKVNQQAVVPLHPFVKAIFEKYTKRGKIQLPTYSSSQYFSTKLKEICKIANIDEEVEVVRNIAGNSVKKVFKKYQLISSHTARRSLASNMFLRRVPVKQIMILTGHKTEASFYKYIRISKEENAVLLASSGFFNPVSPE